MKEEYPYSTLKSWLRDKAEADGKYRNWLDKQFGGLLFKEIDVIFSKPIDDFETVDSIEIKFNQLSPSKICDCLQKIKEIFKNVSLEKFVFTIEDIGEKENVFAKIIIGDYDSLVIIKDSSTAIRDKIASIKLSDNFEQIKNSRGKVDFVFTIKLTFKNDNSIDIQETIPLNICENEKECEYWKKLSKSGVGYIYDLISKYELKRDGGNHYINEKLLKCDFFKAALEYDEKERTYRNLFHDLFNDTYSEEDTKRLEKAMDIVFLNPERKKKLNNDWRRKGLIYFSYFSYRCADKKNESKEELLSAYEYNKNKQRSFPEDLLEGDDVADSFRVKCLSEMQLRALEKQYKSKKFIDSLFGEVYLFFKSCRNLENKDLVDKIDVFIDSYENGIERFYKQKQKCSEDFKTFRKEVQEIEDKDYFSSLLKMKGERISSKYRNLYIDYERIHAKKAWDSIFNKVECKMILIKKALQLLRDITREYGFYTACRDKWYSNYKSYKNYTQNKFPFINDQNYFPNHTDVCNIIKGYYGFLKVKDRKLILVDGLVDIKTDNGKPKWPGLVIYCNSIDISKNNESLMNNMQSAKRDEKLANDIEENMGKPQDFTNYQIPDAKQLCGEIPETPNFSVVKSYTKEQVSSNAEANLTSTHRKQ